MNRRSARIRPNDTLRVAAELLVLSSAGELAVVDDAGLFLGVVSEQDVLRALMPDFSEVKEGAATLEAAYTFFLSAGASRAEDPVTTLVLYHSLTVSPDDELLQPAAAMISRHLSRLPVVEDGRFVGTISQADLCWALLCDLSPGARVG